MTAKEVLSRFIQEGLPPEKWGRWVWKTGQGKYGLSGLVPQNTLPPVEEGGEVLFWWGGVNFADIPYFPEQYIPVNLLPEDAETVEEIGAWLKELSEDERVRVEEEAERVLIGHLLAECIRELPDREREDFANALWDLRDLLEADIALEAL
jgi:hypothetical protein